MEPLADWLRLTFSFDVSGRSPNLANNRKTVVSRLCY